MDREDRAKQIQDLFEQSRQSFKEAFPVSKRIQTLEAYLEDETMSHQHTNIRAALQLYQTGQLEYGYGLTIFAQGRVISLDAIPKNLLMEPKWAEVHAFPTSFVKCLYGVYFLIISGQGIGTQLENKQAT